MPSDYSNLNFNGRADIRHIALSRGMTAIVDADDYEALMQHKWSAKKCRNNWYAVRTTYPENKPVYMHRQLLGLIDKAQCDHRNGNTLDNRRGNLRRCTPHPARSACGLRGVTFHKRRSHLEGPWSASIRTGDKRVHLGFFPSSVKAAEAYDRAAVAKYGEFAWLNCVHVEELRRALGLQ